MSFLFVGLVSLAGKRGSAPTMVLSRAAFGVHGNALPSAVSYLLLVGWEVVLVSLSTKAVATVFETLGWSHGTPVKVIAFLVVIAVIVLAGIKGFDAILRLADLADHRARHRDGRLHPADPRRGALGHGQRTAERLVQGGARAPR